MKLLISLFFISAFTISADQCGKKKRQAGSTYKAKLETKGICMNYTLRLLEGDIDTSMINVRWSDDSTGNSYNKVFGLGSPCTFPKNIEQGDDFYFFIDTSQKQQCAVCMAFYPSPPRKLSIKVLDK